MIYDYANDWIIPEIGEEFEVWDRITGRSIKVRCERCTDKTNEAGYTGCEKCCFWEAKCKFGPGNATNLLCGFDDRHDWCNVHFVKVPTK